MKQIITAALTAILVTACATQDTQQRTQKNAATSTDAKQGEDIRALMAMLDGREPLTKAEISKIAKDASAFPLGSKNNPVRAHMPPGQRAYLDRLRCADGLAPTYKRAGNAGLGPYQSIQDIYVVTCENSAPAETRIYIDMYHPQHVETVPVAGFTMAPEEVVEE